MRKNWMAMTALGLMSLGAHAEEAVDPAYLAFLQARGEAPWINAGADQPEANSAYRPIPALETFPANAAKRELGFALFHDARLSRDGTIGCPSCHMGMHGGTDNKSLSQGIDGATGTMNAPTVFNAAFNFRQFWDGRALDLDEQSLAPITDPVEMGHDLNLVIAELKADADYTELFSEIYPDGITAGNLGNAIAQHTRDMTRTDSPFNAHLTDSSAPLSTQELRGWDRFNALGCVSCHNGINLGGNSYQRLSNTGDFFAGMRAPTPADDGLFRRTQREEDRHVFKVPGLHNVALTAPYFHDGSVATLAEAVAKMGELQAGRTLSGEDVADIVAFLNSLSSQFFSMNAPRMTGTQIQENMQQQLQGMDHSQHHGAGMHDHAQHQMQTPAEPQAPTQHQHGNQ